MIGVTTDQLATLVALADEGTFEAAARRLHITASAVSQRVKAAEQSIGQLVVQRTNPVVPTAAGDILLRHARQIELLDRSAQDELGRVAEDGGRLTVALAVNADSLATWFLEALVGIEGEDAIVFDVHREDQEHTLTLLRSGRVMAAVTSTAEAVQGCTSEALGLMRYRAACTPEFASRWALVAGSLSGLAEAPVVTFDRKDALQQDFLDAAVGGHAHPPRHFIPNSTDFDRAVGIGLGWGMLPEQQCADALAAGTLVDLAPESPRDVPLFWQRWSLKSPVLDAVTARVVEVARKRLITR